ncbi:AI-2E family transporter [Pontibacter burrus]|uniref:AI-2E family transporter n=1 Tax=Pontibacter burrus TaxID=2704466 RepID=A0A6B3LKI8_9BACT|nr:AI-2E family transporter [Pontibacter burrus]NEM97442.1 AI-2E family transporter [Pontibacter burrus]
MLEKKPPSLPLVFYAKLALVLVGIYVFVAILSITQAILVPFLFGVIISIVLHPIVNWLVQRRISRGLAILITLAPVILLTGIILFFITTQAGLLSSLFPKILLKMQVLLHQLLLWISGLFHTNALQVTKWATETEDRLILSTSASIGQIFITLSYTLEKTLLACIYIVLLLFYEPLIVTFLYKLFERRTKAMAEIFTETRALVQKYLTGLVLEAAIVASMYAVGLYLIGIEFALLLGVIAAFLNVIPYIGGAVALSLMLMVTFITKDTMTSSLLVLALAVLIHFIDNTFIIPKLVASKVQINALVAITVVLAGHALWGIAGMILSIPLTGIIKLFFDRIDVLKPWGLLLGNRKEQA